MSCRDNSDPCLNSVESGTWMVKWIEYGLVGGIFDEFDIWLFDSRCNGLWLKI